LKISCIVLAGGKGLRLGRDKVRETVGNKDLLELVLSHLSSFDSDIIVVGAREQSLPSFAGYPKLRIVTDIYPGKGPLGGIHTGLAASNSCYNLVVASDMPFLNQDLLCYMVQVSAGFDLVVPRLGNLVEPLHAVYSKGCLPAIECLLKQGNLSTSQLLTLVKVRYVESEEIDRFDPKHLGFFNINTEADLERARELERVERRLSVMLNKYGVRIYPIPDSDRIRIKQTVRRPGSRRYVIDTMEDGEHREAHIDVGDTAGIADAVRRALRGELERG